LDLKEIVYEGVHLAQDLRPMVGFREDGNELLFFIKRGELTEYLSNY
jgi:hypothetical protein